MLNSELFCEKNPPQHINNLLKYLETTITKKDGHNGLGTSCCYSFLKLSFVCVVLEYGFLRTGRKLVKKWLETRFPVTIRPKNDDKDKGR
jgi:hypothetical protein